MKLIPYIEIDGQRNRKDSYIKRLYEQMVEDGTVNSVFSDGQINNADQFLHAMKTSCKLSIVVEEEPIAIVWLNRFEGKTARLHFCFFKKAWGARSVEIGRFIVSQLLDYSYEKEYIYDSLIGYIPVSNKPAIGFFKKLGVKFVGELPEGHWNHFKQQSEPALVVYMNRGCLSEDLH